MPRGVPNTTVRERFDRKIEKTESCWIWTGAIDNIGYGCFTGDRKNDRAHRWAWFFHTGKWPAQFICHHCDNRRCVNPDHLFAGTNADNARDAATKGRMGRSHTLTLTQRNAIKAACDAGLPQRQIAIQFGTSQATVSEINRGLHEPRGPWMRK